MKLNEQEELKKQWIEALGTGWPCVCWRNYERLRLLRYFFKISDDIYMFSCRVDIDDPGIEFFEDYRPLSTPLDYAPDWATHIRIAHTCGFKFLKLDPKFVKHMYADKETEWLPWPNCPKGMIGKTFRIPDDWRIKL